MGEIDKIIERLFQLANDEGTAQIHDAALEIARLIPFERRKAEAEGFDRGRREMAREVFALHEDTVERYHAIAERDTEGKQGAYSRGRIVEAKSIAKAIGAILPPSRAILHEKEH
ncbi:hypothetical protein [Bradyrhizobium icense]|uniref:Uncharacterized protein n=1 Tax=Bradyrhizobium icense TaxID=1274631 RepID=A0A1B1UD19_9BRAD|nr:hypothetical protein [Bradyrhizobium icense]ANW00654.1 hypothetical protein LMTR13_11245 [Bradyrhizobium icense]